jgi:hypothetical protein
MALPNLFSLRDEYRIIFGDLIRDAVSQELKPLIAAVNALKGQTAAEYLSTDETLKLLHISKPTLHKLRAKGLIECVQSSDNRVLYKRSQIELYLAAQQKGGVKRA